MSIKVHSLHHNEYFIEQIGPPRAFTCWEFEGFLSFLRDSIHTTGAPTMSLSYLCAANNMYPIWNRLLLVEERYETVMCPAKRNIWLQTNSMLCNDMLVQVKGTVFMVT